MSVKSANSGSGPSIQWAPELRHPSTEGDNAFLTDEEEDEEDYREDWSRTTDDKNSFAAKERQRNIGHLKWKNIENYPKPNSPGLPDPRSGSILSVFEIGHEDGKRIPEDPKEQKEYERRRRLSSSGVTQLEKIEDYPQLKKDYEAGRLGSVLGVFVKENQHFDDVIVVSEDKDAPTERRGSIAEPTIEKIENYPTLHSKEQRKVDGRNGSILGVFADDHDDLDAADVPLPDNKERRGSSVSKKPVIENYPENSHKRALSGSNGGLEAPALSPRDARRGSVLSLWTSNSDDHEFDDVKDSKDSDVQSTHSSTGSKSLDVRNQRKGRALSGSERRGSILSMWAPGKDKEGNDVIDHDDDDAIEEEKI